MRGWAWLGAAIAMTACGGSNPPPGNDAGPELMLPVAMADTDGNAENGTEAPADFSCVGTETAPAAGAAGMFDAHFYDFQSGPGTPAANTMVQIFTDNVVTAGCTAPACLALTTDAMGDVSVMANHDGWISYRVPAGGSFVTTIGYNRAAPAMGSTDPIGLPVVGSATIGLIPSLFRRTRVPGTGIVSGNLADCNGDTVEGAVLRLFRDGDEILPGPAATDFFVGYFNAMTGLPSATADYTDADGIYASANVEATTSLVKVELWAVTSEGAEPTRVACEAIQVAADAVSIISVGPTRSDYASGHPCAE